MADKPFKFTSGLEQYGTPAATDTPSVSDIVRTVPIQLPDTYVDPSLMPQAPPLPPKPTPVTVGETLKHMAIGMIPVVGPALNAPYIQKRQQEKTDYLLNQAMYKQQLLDQEKTRAEALKEQYKSQVRQYNINRIANYFQVQNPNADIMQVLDNASAYVDGRAMAGYKNDTTKAYFLKLKNNPNPVMSLRRPDGKFVMQDPTGMQMVPVMLSDVENGWEVGTDPKTLDTATKDLQWKAEQRQHWAAYNMSNEGPKIVDPKYVPSDLDYANAEMWWKQNNKTESGGVGMAYANELIKNGVAPQEAYRRALTAPGTNTFGLNAPVRETSRLDKSYEYHAKEMDTTLKPLQDSLNRFSRLQETLNQNSMQADALVAPELLTVMAGGQGSGMRMNEAEIARIVGGRTLLQGLKAKLQKFSVDPSHASSLDVDQRKQAQALLDAVRKKLDYKQSIMGMARQRLIDANSPEEHRKVFAQMQSDSFGVDQGNIRVVGGSIYERQKDGTWVQRITKP